MYIEYTEQMLGHDNLLAYDQVPKDRTSDINLPPAISALLLSLWISICLVGFAIIFLAKNVLAGIAIIALPTFIGMVIKPTFGLCLMMLVLPTGAGIGYNEIFSLNRGVGLALAASFALNLIISRPKLRVSNRVLWVIFMLTCWIVLKSLTTSFGGIGLRPAFTQIQLLVFVFIIYWILDTNSTATFRWALRSYVIGTLGTIAIAVLTGAAIRSVEESTEARYTATAGNAINANLLAALVVMAFLAAIYLFARDKNLIWRFLYLVAIIILPVMLLKIGSRGAILALGITLLSPLLFIRQVRRRPILAVIMLSAVLIGSLSASLIVKRHGLEASVAERLTDIEYAKESIGYRTSLIRTAIDTAISRPTGTGYFEWFERTGLKNFPHSDFFFILGIYGFPGALLFILFVILMLKTVKITPLSLEKFYTRAVLTYLLVIGMNNSFVFKKFYWAFLVFVMAGQEVARFYTQQNELQAPENEQYWPENPDQYQATY